MYTCPPGVCYDCAKEGQHLPVQVELSQGGLPWREVQSDADKDSVLLRKQAALDDPHTMAAPGETLPGTGNGTVKRVVCI